MDVQQKYETTIFLIITDYYFCKMEWNMEGNIQNGCNKYKKQVFVLVVLTIESGGCLQHNLHIRSIKFVTFCCFIKTAES